jgi:hypothetical protein
MSNDTLPKIATAGEQRLFALLLVVTALGLFALALNASQNLVPLFWAFALLPGAIGIANYIVTLRQRDAEHQADKNTLGINANAEVKHRPTFSEALAAAILLTAVFGIVAQCAVRPDRSQFDGLIYAGYGAYVSTVWLMPSGSMPVHSPRAFS